MKYVIFKNRKGLVQPVIFPDVVTHSTIMVKGAVATSAGFLTINPFRRVTVLPMRSESLNLGPAIGDQAYLQAAVDNSGSYAFEDFGL